MEIEPFVLETEEGDVEDVYFDLTLIVDRQNNLQVVDNRKKDWTDFVDSNTLLAKQVKLSV